MSQIEIKNLSRDFVAGVNEIHAVQDVNLKVNKGEFISIVGHSGSGKTTLISLLGGILKPSSGQILFNGQDICTYHDDRLSEYRSQKVGFMFQFASLMPILNTKENVLLPILFFNGQKSREELALQYLNEVGLSDKVNSYPAELSGGQQRRVAIARALINEPEIILADEPTGDLDEKTEADVMALFKRLNKNRNVTIIMVTHNLTLAKEAQRTLVMTQGTLSEKKGTPRIVQKIQTTPPKRDKQRKPRR